MDNNSNESKYTSNVFISQLNKIYNLKENSIFSDEEFNSKKNQFIIDLMNKGISQELDDFLSDILILKDKNILTIDEIKEIKNSFASKEIEKEENPVELNSKYYCGDCESEIELSPEEIKKGKFICPNCSATNLLGNNIEAESKVVKDEETEVGKDEETEVAKEEEIEVVKDEVMELNPEANDYYCRFCNELIELDKEEIEKAEFTCPICGKLNSIDISEANLNLRENNTSNTDIDKSTDDLIVCKHCNKTFNKNFTIVSQDGILCKYCGEMNLFSSDEKLREVRREVINQQNYQPSKKKLSATAKVFITLGSIVFVLFVSLYIIINIDYNESQKKKYELEQKRIKEEKEQREFDLKNKSSEEINREYDNWQKENKKERENAEWEKKRKEREDEVKRQYNSPEMQKARDRDLQMQKEADKKEMEYLKKRYLDK